MRGVINNPYLVGNSIIMKKTKLSKIVKGGILQFLLQQEL